MFRTLLEVIAIRVNADYVAARVGKQSAPVALAGRLLAFGAGIARSAIAAPGEVLSLARTGRVPVISFSSTTNQTSALEPIVGPIEGLRWVVVNQSSPDERGPLRFPSGVVSIVSILTLPATLFFAVVFLASGKEHGSLPVRLRGLAFSFDEVLRAWGYLAAAHVLLARHRPEVVVMSNDHNAINRALCLAGGRRGVKTVYVQHAPVTGVFPRLVCSHAFLDSQASADIYRLRPTETVIEALGASRYDARFQTGRADDRTRAKTVSLCMNKVDDPARILAYHEALSDRGWRVIVRPHPGIADRDLAFLPTGARIDRRPIHEHLREVDFLVAGNSGVLLDAFMAGVVPLMATDVSDVVDYYGFLERRAVYPVSLDTLPAFDATYGSRTLAALTPGMKAFNSAVGTTDAYSVANQIRCRIVELADRATVPEDAPRD